MNDEFFKEQAKKWAGVHRKVGDDDIERTLYLFGKEMAREARHKAADIAQAAARDIMNMHR